MMDTAKCMMKDIFFMGLGIGATLAYQKYSKPMMRQMEKMVDKTIQKVDDLEEMM